jgi:hypothetical protein
MCTLGREGFAEYTGVVMSRRGMKVPVLVGLVGVSVLVLAGCGNGMVDETARDSTGEITEGGELGVFRLEVGDCLNDPTMLSYSEDAPDEVAQFDAVPCSDVHTGEVVLVDDDFFAEESELPSSEVLESRSYEACAVAVEEYTGEPFEDSYFDAYPVFPTKDSWEAMDDRGIVCVGVVLSEKTWYPIESTGSMKAPA